tara:strand:- start:1068 stop:1316 length:249 start_codon:yes stop_codon:yes gene_type:complete
MTDEQRAIERVLGWLDGYEHFNQVKGSPPLIPCAGVMDAAAVISAVRNMLYIPEQVDAGIGLSPSQWNDARVGTYKTAPHRE